MSTSIAGLSRRCRRRRRATFDDLHVDARLQAAAAGPDELLAELQEVLRQLPEGHVGRRGARRTTTSPTTICPSSTSLYDMLKTVEHDAQGQDERLFLPGLQPADGRSPTRQKIAGGALQAEVPGRHRSARDRDGALLGEPRRVQQRRFPGRSRPRCSSSRPPASPRTKALHQFQPRLQWHWTGGEPPGEAETTSDHRRHLHCVCASCTGRRAAPSRSDHQSHLDLYKNPAHARRRTNSRRRSTATRSRTCPTRPIRPRSLLQGRQAAAGLRPADATTARPRAAAGSTPAATPRPATWPRRDTSDPSGIGRRIPNGPSPGRPTGASSTTAPRPTPAASRGASARSHRVERREMDRRSTCRTMAPTMAPEKGVGAVHHEPGRRGAAVRRGHDARRTVPRTLRAVRVARRQRRSIRRSAATPSARVFKGDQDSSATPTSSRSSATTYRLTEHFHYWTKHLHVNAVLQPEFFVEISEQLAAREGHQAGRLGAGRVQARLHQGEGRGDQAHSGR